MVESLPLTAEELAERRKAERRLRLMDLHEVLAIQAETTERDELRAIYAQRYRTLIGIVPAQRDAFRYALENRVNVTVDELAEAFSDG